MHEHERKDSGVKKALVVDDNEINRTLAMRLLAKTGWAVDEAECGEDALRYLAETPVALVLLDISMPKISGPEICRRIRDQGLGGTGVKVVAYTAHAMPDEILGFLEGGFDSVLLKPLSRGSIMATLTELGF